MAKEYTTKDGKRIVGWYRMGGRAIPIVEGQGKKGEGKNSSDAGKKKTGDDDALNKKIKDAVKRNKGAEKFKRKALADGEMEKRATDKVEKRKYQRKFARDIDEMERRAGGAKRGTGAPNYKEPEKKKGDKGVEKFKRKARADFEMAEKAKSKKESKKLYEKSARDIDEMQRRAGGGQKGLADKKQKDAIRESLKRRKDRDYRETDTSDARAQLENKEKTPKGQRPNPTSNSLSGHMDKNGKLTPEREKAHRKIIDDTFKGKKPVEGQATMTMLGGGSASGKSSLPSRVKAEKDSSSIILDPDAFKAKLPDYAKMSAENKRAAEYYHEESSALSKRTYAVALGENYNVVYDGTGDGSVSSATKKIKQARDAGYKVNGEYTTVDVEEAVRRNRKRYEDAVARGDKDARLPPEQRVREIHANVTNVAMQTAHLYDDFKLYDNNVEYGKPKVLIATAGNGKGLTAVKGQEKALKAFLDKGSVKYTIVDGVVVINPKE